jgi:hypothetical protein
MTSPLPALLVPLVIIVGCGTATTLPDAGSTNDAFVALDSAVVTDAGGDGSASPCDYVTTIDRSCTMDSDCHVGLHQTNCCGSAVMIGFRATVQSAYASSESACMASYPACGCPAQLPTTDSGETVTDTSAVLAACVIVGPTRRCETYVMNRPPDGR